MKPSRPSGPLQRFVRLRALVVWYAWQVAVTLGMFAIGSIAFETAVAAIYFPAFTLFMAFTFSEPNTKFRDADRRSL